MKTCSTRSRVAGRRPRELVHWGISIEMADYAAKHQYRCKKKGRVRNIHRGVNLVNVSLPAEEGDSKEHRNDQWREDVGGGPSLDRTRRNGEDEENDGRCGECALSDIAKMSEARSLTRQCRDADNVKTSSGDRLCRCGDEDEACGSDCGSYDRRKVEDPRPCCVLNKQCANNQSQDY
jgi:hypothetical protein